MDMSAAEVKRAASAQPSSHSHPTELNGSEIMVRCLQAEGVKYLWGYPGGAVLYIYDELFKQKRRTKPVLDYMLDDKAEKWPRKSEQRFRWKLRA